MRSVKQVIKVQTSLIWPGCAQGKYIVKARGFILAVLRWGNNDGPLNSWGPFAYVPIDPAGNGMFFFPGKRGIPKDATHVWRAALRMTLHLLRMRLVKYRIDT